MKNERCHQKLLVDEGGVEDVRRILFVLRGEMFDLG
jgi:hypothetical protein